MAPKEQELQPVLADISRRINQYIELDNYVKVRELISEAVRNHPEDPPTLRLAIHTYLATKDFDKAMSAAKHLCNVEGFKLKGDMYILSVECARALEETQYDKALDKARHAYEIDKNEYITNFHLAKCLYYKHDTGNSLPSLIKTCKSIDKTLDICIIELNYLNKMHKLDELKKIVRRENMLNPNSRLAVYGNQLINQSSKPEGNADNAYNVQNAIDETELADAMKKLNDLIGLTAVKEEIEKYKKTIQFETIRRQKLGFSSDEKLRYNFIFYGNPGTGKTTVARLFAKIFRALGVLKEGHLVEVDRSGLVGEYIGQTAIKTKKAIDDAMGGVLFIDEAYTLAGKGENDFGKEALETILKAAEDCRGDIVIILAGYKNEMNQLMEMNPGLKSRFNKFLSFEDYSEDELLQIAKRQLDKECYHLTPTGEKAFMQVISKRKVDEKFGNAREVELVIRSAIEQKALNIDFNKLDSMDNTELRTITAAEFGVNLEESTEERIRKSYDGLDRLIGLDNVKKKIRNLISYVDYQKAEKDRGMIDSMPSLHMVFSGNPGTGKTTVANLISEILRDMGILKKGHLVTAERQDLVAEYVGQTAIKTANKIKEAYGGVLFIDEAYSLASTSDSDYGKEAIATLIKEMEDNRDKLVVILAGYTDDMLKLLETNSGFSSRIGENIIFEDYTPEELYHIFIYNCKKEQYTFLPEVETYVKDWLQHRYDHRDKNFGNAREVRKLFESMKISLATRVQDNQLQGSERRNFVPDDIINCTIY
jgi:SpoVK/Ycf46/Vps4 family AAA+-type ATPase